MSPHSYGFESYVRCDFLIGYWFNQEQRRPDAGLLDHLHSTPSHSYHVPFAISPAPIAQLVECPLRGTGGHGFDPGPRHTKVVKNGTSCSSLGTQIYGVELGLVDPVSG